jgi:hypothetical protein
VTMRISDEDRWHQWSTWYSTARADVATLVGNRSTWTNLEAVLSETGDSRLRESASWVSLAYIQMQFLGVTRQCDRTGRRATLGCLLREMSLRPEIASRWSTQGPIVAQAEEAARFSDRTEFLIGDAHQIAGAVVAADVDMLNRETAAARALAKRPTISADVRDTSQAAVKQGDRAHIDRAVDVLQRLITKYGGLFDSAHPLFP